MGLLLIHWPPCCVATSLPELLEASRGWRWSFPGLNLPSLGAASEAAQEVMATQIVIGLTQDSGHMPNLIFLLEQWQHDLVADVRLSVPFYSFKASMAESLHWTENADLLKLMNLLQHKALQITAYFIQLC